MTRRFFIPAAGVAVTLPFGIFFVLIPYFTSVFYYFCILRSAGGGKFMHTDISANVSRILFLAEQKGQGFSSSLETLEPSPLLTVVSPSPSTIAFLHCR